VSDFKGFSEKLGKSFTQQDKSTEKDLPTCLVKKWKTYWRQLEELTNEDGRICCLPL
jgi:hypothetical protein